MKKFLQKISFFVALIAIVWAGLEVFYRTVPNNYIVKDQGIRKRYKDCEVLLLGNSHVFYGLNPAYFSHTTYNLANISQTLLFDELLVKAHADSLKNLKAIVIAVEHSSLIQDEAHPELQWRKYFYRTQMHLDVKGINWYDPCAYSLALAPRSGISYESVKKYFSGENLFQCDSTGWAPLRGNSPFLNAETGHIIVGKHEYGKNDFDVNLKRLQQLIAYCRERNIKVFLINMPVSRFYADVADPKLIKAKNAACVELADNKEVFYKSFFNNADFTDVDFYDVDHLNTEGAKKCSILVNDFIHKNLD